MTHRNRALLACLALASALLAGLPNASQAAERSFRGTVTHVSDGDTLWVRPATGGRPVAVRLVGIDAPELCQPHGPEARQALDRQARRQAVTVQVQGRDDYDRLLARIELEGQDLGGWLVTTGHAWSSRWRRDPGPYAQQQALARQAGRGLWARPAVEPRHFRREHGRCPARSSPPFRR